MISEETRQQIITGALGQDGASWPTDLHTDELFGIKLSVIISLIDTSGLDDPTADWVLMLYHSDYDTEHQGCRFELFGFDRLDQAVSVMVAQVNNQSLGLMSVFVSDLNSRRLGPAQQQVECERFEKSLAKDLWLLRGQLKELGASSKALFGLSIPQRSER